MTLLQAQKCGTCPIRHRAVCARCDDDEMLRLESMKVYRGYAAGQAIVWGGDPMEFVASVVTGTATISSTMEDGRTQTLGLLLPSDFIGRPGRDYAPYDVTAVTDVVLCCFRRKPFERLIEDIPHIAQRLLEMSLDELDAARDWMLLLGRKTAREKIASFLCLVARRSNDAKSSKVPRALTITLPLTREAIAEYLGLTLETVSRQFSNLKRDGSIVLSGKRIVEIPDYPALLAEAGDDPDIED